MEVIPKKVLNHPSVINHAKKLGRKAHEILLDRSYHHTAMIQGRLESAWKRGRPDIVHFALIEALSTPLYLKKRLKVYVHTINDKVIVISEDLRVPRSYLRFEGLMIKLFLENVIKSNEGNKILLELYNDTTFERLIKNIIKPNKAIALSSTGVKSTAEEVSKNILEGGSPHCAFIIGGFPKGHFSESTCKLIPYSYSIAKLGLDAHVVIARILYECEKVLSIN